MIPQKILFHLVIKKPYCSSHSKQPSKQHDELLPKTSSSNQNSKQMTGPRNVEPSMVGPKMI